MSEQLSIDQEARKLARRRDVETSREAAAANAGGKASHRRRILQAHAQKALDHRGGRIPRPMREAGLIDDEAAQIVGLDSTETTRRCSDLRNLGLLEWHVAPVSGIPFRRLTRSGRAARVSVITEAGWDALDA